MGLKPCLGCGTLSNGARCSACTPPRRRGTTTEEGYGWAHQQARARLVPLALGEACPMQGPRCTGVMVDARLMDLHHSDPTARLRGEPGDVVVCAPCNRSYGDGTYAKG